MPIVLLSLKSGKTQALDKSDWSIYPSSIPTPGLPDAAGKKNDAQRQLVAVEDDFHPNWTLKSAQVSPTAFPWSDFSFWLLTVVISIFHLLLLWAHLMSPRTRALRCSAFPISLWRNVQDTGRVCGAKIRMKPV